MLLRARRRTERQQRRVKTKATTGTNLCLSVKGPGKSRSRIYRGGQKLYSVGHCGLGRDPGEQRCQESAGVPSTPAAVAVDRHRKSRCFLPALAVRSPVRKANRDCPRKGPVKHVGGQQKPLCSPRRSVCLQSVYPDQNLKHQYHLALIIHPYRPAHHTSLVRHCPHTA